MGGPSTTRHVRRAKCDRRLGTGATVRRRSLTLRHHKSSDWAVKSHLRILRGDDVAFYEEFSPWLGEVGRQGKETTSEAATSLNEAGDSEKGEGSLPAINNTEMNVSCTGAVL